METQVLPMLTTIGAFTFISIQMHLANSKNNTRFESAFASFTNFMVKNRAELEREFEAFKDAVNGSVQSFCTQLNETDDRITMMARQLEELKERNGLK